MIIIIIIRINKVPAAPSRRHPGAVGDRISSPTGQGARVVFQNACNKGEPGIRGSSSSDAVSRIKPLDP